MIHLPDALLIGRFRASTTARHTVGTKGTAAFNRYRIYNKGTLPATVNRYSWRVCSFHLTSSLVLSPHPPSYMIQYILNFSLSPPPLPTPPVSSPLLSLHPSLTGKSVVPESEFIDCLQKIKYSFNILGKVKDDMQQPSAPDLIHILMTTVPTVLSQCPRKNVAPTVVSPLLTQKALTLLSSCVTEKERNLWQSLGDAWQRTRADWPNGKNVPPYIPEFSDGWIPSKIPDEMPPREDQAQFPPEEQTPPINRRSQMLIMRVLHDFEARNSRELSVKKGDSVEVLDQSRQWWMVQNYRQERGFIPSNILESGEEAQVPVHSLSLQPSSRPEEVTAWLQEKDFSTITVRCLGVLRGSQLLGLSREELKAVCPEEGGRVYTQLNEVRAALRI
ncbi:hypothetical protein FKM82_016495 [Ascaphus truei]